jgi:hypothetical protein
MKGISWPQSRVRACGMIIGTIALSACDANRGDSPLGLYRYLCPDRRSRRLHPGLLAAGKCRRRQEGGPCLSWFRRVSPRARSRRRRGGSWPRDRAAAAPRPALIVDDTARFSRGARSARLRVLHHRPPRGPAGRDGAQPRGRRLRRLHETLYGAEWSAFASAADFKAPIRAKIERAGHTIIENMGDQPSDLIGGHTEKHFLLPDQFYRIP